MFPPFCPGCESYLGIRADPAHLCGECESKILAMLKEHDRWQLSGGALDALYSLGRYGAEPLTTLIHKIKYQKKDWIFAGLRPALDEYLRLVRLEDVIDAVAAVPLHPRRQRERGFNQAELLGRLIAGKIHRPFLDKILLRSKATKPQARITDPTKRRSDVREAFALNFFPLPAQAGRGQGEGFEEETPRHCDLKGKRILLVDDVSTTGATIKECAKILKKAGALKVFGFVLAKG
ncbi:MAG: ComF family protein [Elusimicrobia bacterium]|nr:ComF family protein [Elusimicrobiota bacterium]